jgi:ABC-type multidrug transport system ATPase subunit
MIEIHDLEMSFPQGPVFRAKKLQSPETGILALTGANGAGKSTLLKILATLILPSRGEVLVNGRSLLQFPREIQKICGYAQSSEQGFYPRLTGQENLQLFSFFRKKNFQPTYWPHFPGQALATPFQDCSTGMKQSFLLARAIAHQPKLLLLDEIGRSFDSELRAKYKNFLQDYAKDHLILTATHDPEEISLATQHWRLENGLLFS